MDGDGWSGHDAWGPHRRSPTAAHRVEHAAFRAVRLLARRLPERAGLLLGGSLGAFAGSVVRIRRGLVDENLARAFPERPRAWRNAVAAASYRHLGREAMAILRFAGRPVDALLDRTGIEGMEAFRSALARGRGAIAVSGHIGNWELGGAIVAGQGIPLDAVATRQGNPLVDADFFRSRTRFGMRIVEKSRAPRHILRALREGRSVALIGDQNVKSGGVFVDFFGVPAATARGPALFALRSGAPLFLIVALATGARDGPLYRLVIREIEVERTGALEDDVRRLTQAHTSALEGFVREAPEQYFWHHRRWKTRPPTGVREEPRAPDPV